MNVELHQLDLRYEKLRTHKPEAPALPAPPVEPLVALAAKIVNLDGPAFLAALANLSPAARVLPAHEGKAT